MSGRAATTSIIEGKYALSVGDPGTAVKPGWLRVPLLSIAELGTGHTPSRSRSDYWDGGVPWIAIPDARDHHTRLITNTTETVSQLGLENSAARILPAMTVGLSRTASVGYVFIMGRPMATSQDFVTWTCSDALDPRFLMYALLAEGDDIRKFGKGSTHTTIYFPEVKAFHLNLAPKPEQRRIVAKLDSLRARSSRARHELDRIPKLIERYKQAILAKAFSGELTADWRSLNSEAADSEREVHSKEKRRRGLLKTRGTNKILEGLDLIQLPEGWNWIQNHRLAADQSNAICAGPFGTIFKAKDFRDEGVPIVFLRHVGEGEYLTRKPTFMDRAVWTRHHQDYSIYGGELLVTKLGDPPGTACIYPDDIGTAMVTPDVMKMTVDSDVASTRYLMHFFNSPICKSLVQELAFGLTRLRIDLTMFKAFPIPLAPRMEQDEVVRCLDSAFASLNKIATEHARAEHLLPKLDQAILAKAFRGELVPQDPNDEPASKLLQRIKTDARGGASRKRQ